jgi:hypothetical protein
MPKLRWIELWDENLTDAAIAPLAGHPTLECIFIRRRDKLTPASLATFASIPRLRNLNIYAPVDNVLRTFNEEDMKAFKAALPSVTVEFR